MPLLRPVVACLLALLLALGGAVCAPMVDAAPRAEQTDEPPCHGDASRDHVPRNDHAPSPSCLRCPLCATVVPTPVLAARPAEPIALAVYVAATPTAPQAPAFEPPTPPPQV